MVLVTISCENLLWKPQQWCLARQGCSTILHSWNVWDLNELLLLYMDSFTVFLSSLFQPLYNPAFLKCLSYSITLYFFYDSILFSSLYISYLLSFLRNFRTCNRPIILFTYCLTQDWTQLSLLSIRFCYIRQAGIDVFFF